MPFEMQTSDAGATLVLSGRLGVQQARPLWDATQAARTGQRPLQVQAAEVEDLDTSIAQILCRAASQGGQLQISGSSDGFLLSLARRGLDKFFVHAADAPASEQAPSPIAAAPSAEGLEPPKAAPKKARSSKERKSRG
jgi:ABC-type transporter Mla MlaB component